MLVVMGVMGGDRPELWQDILVGCIALCLWGMLTLSLEAKHKHAYREQIRYHVPTLFLLVAAGVGYFLNPQALGFIFLTWLFTYCYIKKETNAFWGMTSSFWRGMYQSSLFFACWSLYAPLELMSLGVIGIGIAVGLLLFSRNLIADIRDVAFDRLTLVIFWGVRTCYKLALGAFALGGLILFSLFPASLVVVPVLCVSLLLLVYDDGYMLHRLSLMVTTFTIVNITLFLKGSLLLYPNMLFLAIASNLFFYEKVARPSNPLSRVPSRMRFLLAKPAKEAFVFGLAHPDRKEPAREQLKQAQ